MADDLVSKLWGLLGALTTVLVTLALIVPSLAAAAGPGAGAAMVSQLAASVPAPAQSAVSAALSQVPAANGAGASAQAVPDSPPPAPVLTPAATRSPAGIAVQAVSTPARPVPQPDAVTAVDAAPTRSGGIRPDRIPGGERPGHRWGHPGAHHRARRTAPARPQARVPIARVTFAQTWSQRPALDVTSRRVTRPVTPARHVDSRRGGGPGGHPGARRFHSVIALITSQAAPPLPAESPPGGAEGSAAGAGGAAAAASAAAVLALIGVCVLRALLPGLLGLGLAPVRSAFLVSRLERPG